MAETRCLHSGRGSVVHISTSEERRSRGYRQGSTTSPAGLCGIALHNNRAGPAVEVDPTRTLPTGLHWCPKCVGVAADRAGLTYQIIEQLFGGIG